MVETRSTNRQWLADDLTVVEAMAAELETYIVHGEPYRALFISTTSGRYKVTMSGGDLLVRLKRLRENLEALPLEEQVRFKNVASNIHRTIYSLHTPFHYLLRHELKARRDQLKWNMEMRHARDDDKADPAELQNRQHIAAIQEELQET